MRKNSPLYCCICGDLNVFQKPQGFIMDAFTNTLYAHKDCFDKAKNITHWTELPNGPLKDAYEKLPE